MHEGLILLIVIIIAAFAWYQGWLNNFLPTSWQHHKSASSAFTSCNQASQIDPNIPCLVYDPVTGLPTNVCARV